MNYSLYGMQKTLHTLHTCGINILADFAIIKLSLTQNFLLRFGVQMLPHNTGNLTRFCMTVVLKLGIYQLAIDRKLKAPAIRRHQLE
jgi:hypothetical protein